MPKFDEACKTIEDFTKSSFYNEHRNKTSESLENHARRIQKPNIDNFYDFPSKFMIAAALNYLKDENQEKFSACLRNAYNMKKETPYQENINALKVLLEHTDKAYNSLRKKIIH